MSLPPAAIAADKNEAMKVWRENGGKKIMAMWAGCGDKDTGKVAGRKIQLQRLGEMAGRKIQQLLASFNYLQ